MFSCEPSRKEGEMMQRRLLVVSALFVYLALSVSATAEVQRAPYRNDASTRLLLHFDEGSPSRVRDAGAYENKLGIGGNMQWRKEGRFGGCLYLDGDWDVVRCGKDGSLSPADQITFEAWVKPEAVDKIQQIISKDIIGVPWYQYHLGIEKKKVVAGVTIAPVRHLSVTSDAEIEINKWTHLAGVYDGETLRLYVDGRQQSAVAKGEGTIIDSGKQLNIGAWSNSYWFKGCIDEVRISSVARYGPSATGSKSGLVIPRAATSPRIDGIMSPGEWRNAARITGFLRNTDGKPTSRPQPVVYFTFDEKNLYVGFTCPFDKLKRDARGHDLTASRDDAIEIFLDPLRSRESYYQFLVNANGAYFEIKNGNNAWSGRWTYRASTGDNKWIGEVSIRFSELGVSTPYDGMEWGFNVCRDYKNPLEWTSVAGVKGAFAQPKLFARAVFRGGPSEVKITSASLRLAYRVVGIEDKHIEAVVDVSAVPPKQRRRIKGIVTLMNSRGKEIVRGLIPRFAATKGKAGLRVTDIPPGEYGLVALLYGKGDVLVGSQEATFIKPDDSLWLGNKIGLDHTVPPPWTPVKVQGNRVACWNREYTFNGTPFPSVVEIGADSILASPIRLGGRANGREIAWSKGEIEFVEKRRDQARFKVENTFGPLTLQSQVTTEFDGMIRLDLKLIPKKAVNL